jgi:NDP-sugar pyrophosphorylase family protein
MGPLSDVVPKPMAPYQGTTLIAQGMKSIRAHVDHTHITVGYKKAMLAEHVIQEGAASALNTEGQSNSWWIYNTLLAHLREPLFVLTCDNVTELDFELLSRNYFEIGAPACMVVPVHPVKGLEGDYIFRQGRIVTALDRNRPNDIYCSGIQVLNPALVHQYAPEQGDFYHLWKQLISAKQLLVADVYPKKWISIDTFEQLVTAGQEG